MPSVFLQAFEGKNKSTPVWFMRQAGRYLPEYRRIREQYSLEAMFSTPELAAEITCQPIKILNVDAAILFADILTLPQAMGFNIRFDNRLGPKIENLITSKADLKNIRPFEGLESLEKTIRMVNQRLPAEIPLIGFAGSPFTVLTYLIEGGSSVNFNKTLRIMHGQPDFFHECMDLLTKNTVKYLNLQKQSGVKAFQLFDTWGGIVDKASFDIFVLPYIQKVFKAVELPSIYYLKNCRHLIESMDKSGADVLSVCHTVELGQKSLLAQTKKGMQGNLFNGILYADDRTIQKEVKKIIAGGRKHKKYIFNLSHGIFPDINPDKLKLIVDLVHKHG